MGTTFGAAFNALARWLYGAANRRDLAEAEKALAEYRRDGGVALDELKRELGHLRRGRVG